MTSAALTALLAERVMRWKVAPSRFLQSGRRWIPQWRFSPLTCIAAAFDLLDQSEAAYWIERSVAGEFTVKVQVGDAVGIARGEPKARAITLAVARALGLDVGAASNQGDGQTRPSR